MTTFVVDRSERGKLALTGAEAKDFLHGQVTNDILALEPGQGAYAAFLTNKGKMLGDLRVFDLGDELLHRLRTRVRCSRCSTCCTGRSSGGTWSSTSGRCRWRC